MTRPYPRRQLTHPIKPRDVLARQLYRFRLAHVVLLSFFISFASGCQNTCHNKPLPDSPEAEFGRWIPHNAQAVFFAEKFSALSPIINKGPQSFAAPHSSLASVFHPLTNSSIAQSGIDPAGRAAAYHLDGHWILLVNIQDQKTLENTFLNHAEAQSLLSEKQRHKSFQLLRLEHANAPPDTLLPNMEMAIHQNHAIIMQYAPHTTYQKGQRTALLHTLLSADDDDNIWHHDRHKAGLLSSVKHASKSAGIYGIIRPLARVHRQVPQSNAIVEAPSDAINHADVLWQRMTTIMGTIAIHLAYDQHTNTIRSVINMPGHPGQPGMIADLGSPGESIPDVAGLLHSGILGVARISADPLKFYNLLRSTLPAPQRREMDNILEYFQNELQINIQRDFLANLSGHAIVVFYGIENAYFKPNQNSFWADIMQLRATREAILLPIKDRAAMQHLFDIFTQISQGNLRRQEVRHTMQYAWMDDGSLKWAIILHDDYMILVDSAAAFDQAAFFERNAAQLAPHLKALNVDTILSQQASAGIFLDTASITQLLDDMDMPLISTLLAPFQSLLLRVEGEGTDERIYLELKLPENIDNSLITNTNATKSN